MKVRAFEDAVWQRERIRVVVRAETDEEVRDYPFPLRYSDTATVNEFLGARIIQRMNGKGFFIVDGHGEWPDGKTSLQELRESYK